MFWIIIFYLGGGDYFYRTGPGFNLICNLRRFYLRATKNRFLLVGKAQNIA